MKTYKKLYEVHKKLYSVWRSMRHRCNSPSCHAYYDYGGRGISMCPEWDTFETFLQWSEISGYSEGLDLDREDNNGNYEPTNCRWVTRRVNTRNRRNTSKYGSCIYKQSQGYLVRILIDGKLKNFGTHESIELATLARDEAQALHGLGG